MFLPKIREIKEALTSLFTKPYTTKFPAGGYTPEKEYRGFPRYDADHCVGCGTCAQVCPSGAITVDDDIEKMLRTLTVNYLSCIHCGQCNENCITEQGIAPTSEYSFSVMDKAAPEVLEKIKKDLVICEGCGEAIACADHLQWVKERLGAKAYAHPTLMLHTQKQFFELEPSAPKAHIRREDYMKSMCAKCRQKVVVADEF